MSTGTGVGVRIGIHIPIGKWRLIEKKRKSKKRKYIWGSRCVASRAPPLLLLVLVTPFVTWLFGCAVHARDAMCSGGSLFGHSDVVELEKAYVVVGLEGHWVRSSLFT